MSTSSSGIRSSFDSEDSCNDIETNTTFERTHITNKSHNLSPSGNAFSNNKYSRAHDECPSRGRAHRGLRHTSWDKSPSRSFLRNFPWVLRDENFGILLIMCMLNERSYFNFSFWILLRNWHKKKINFGVVGVVIGIVFQVYMWNIIMPFLDNYDAMKYKCW